MCTSKPKIPTPAPVIERQAYKDPASRESLTGANPDRVRRAMMGVMTSAQGVKGPASTTKRVKLGGDQNLAPGFSSANSNGAQSVGGAPPAPVPVLAVSNPITSIKPAGISGGGFRFAGNGGGVGRYRSRPN